jgi:hypothetical protein
MIPGSVIGWLARVTVVASALVMFARPAAADTGPALPLKEPAAPALADTSWRFVETVGEPLPPTAEATLEFSADGSATVRAADDLNLRDLPAKEIGSPARGVAWVLHNVPACYLCPRGLALDSDPLPRTPRRPIEDVVEWWEVGSAWGRVNGQS